MCFLSILKYFKQKNKKKETEESAKFIDILSELFNHFSKLDNESKNDLNDSPASSIAMVLLKLVKQKLFKEENEDKPMSDLIKSILKNPNHFNQNNPMTSTFNEPLIHNSTSEENEIIVDQPTNQNNQMRSTVRDHLIQNSSPDEIRVVSSEFVREPSIQNSSPQEIQVIVHEPPNQNNLRAPSLESVFVSCENLVDI